MCLPCLQVSGPFAQLGIPQLSNNKAYSILGHYNPEMYPAQFCILNYQHDLEFTEGCTKRVLHHGNKRYWKGVKY